MSSSPVPRAIARAAWIASGAAIVLSVVTLARVPIPWLDENYIASAAYAIALGRPGIPSILPPGPSYTPLSDAYGPVFFRVTALSIHLLGLSAFAVRLICAAGAVAAAAAAAWLTRRAGAARGWPALAFALVTLSPEIGTTSANGRMDTFAIALEVTAFVAIIVALERPERSSAVFASLAAGVCLLLAALTTPRTFPLVAATFAVLVALPLLRRFRAASATALLCSGAVVMAGCLLWVHHLGFTPIGWVLWHLRSTQVDPQTRLLAGARRDWNLDVRNSITPAVTVAALLVIAGLHIWNRRRTNRWRLLVPIPLLALWAACVLNAAFHFEFTNHVFLSSSYFVVPLFVTTIAASVVAGERAVASRTVLALWLAVAVLFAAGRAAKYVAVWQTWDYRDPAPLTRFIERWVPRGSLVFGYDQYYFYAVENAGSTFRAWTPKPATLAPLMFPDAFDASHRPTAAATRRFLLWPTRGPLGAVPKSFACALPQVVATFSISTVNRVGVERIGGFDAGLHGYPDTVLYEVPDDCRP